MTFVVPDAERRLRTIGTLAELPLPLRRAFSADFCFDPVAQPGPQDWLTVAAEKGQTYEAFARTATNRPDGTRESRFTTSTRTRAGIFTPARLHHLRVQAKKMQVGRGVFVKPRQSRYARAPAGPLSCQLGVARNRLSCRISRDIVSRSLTPDSIVQVASVASPHSVLEADP